jgi:hypothetical protein
MLSLSIYKGLVIKQAHDDSSLPLNIPKKALTRKDKYPKLTPSCRTRNLPFVFFYTAIFSSWENVNVGQCLHCQTMPRRERRLFPIGRKVPMPYLRGAQSSYVQGLFSLLIYRNYRAVLIFIGTQVAKNDKLIDSMTRRRKTHGCEAHPGDGSGSGDQGGA